MDRLTKDWIKCQKEKSNRRWFEAPRRGSEHLEVIWSNKETMLSHMLNGWAKKDEGAPRAFLLAPLGSLLCHGVLILIHEVWFYGMHVLFVPCMFLLHQGSVVAPILMFLCHTWSFLHHHGASWTILVLDKPSMLCTPLWCSRMFQKMLHGRIWLVASIHGPMGQWA